MVRAALRRSQRVAPCCAALIVVATLHAIADTGALAASDAPREPARQLSTSGATADTRIFEGTTSAGLSCAVHSLRVAGITPPQHAQDVLVVDNGADAAPPSLSWSLSCEFAQRGDGDPRLHDNSRAIPHGVSQTAHHAVLRDADTGAVLWDAGRVVEARQHTLLPRPLLPLPPKTRFRWAVAVEAASEAGGNGATGAAANEVVFETGPSADPRLAGTREGWNGAQWIGGHNLLRHDLTLPGAPGVSVTSARAWVTGLGLFQLHVNGAKVGDHIEDPGQTVYYERVLYVTFNITQSLHGGANEVTAELGNGKYGYLDAYCNMTAAGGAGGAGMDGCRTLLVSIEANCSDGSMHTLVSDDSWQVRQGPRLYDHNWHGEIYDARLEEPPTVAGAASWSPAAVMTPRVGTLTPQTMPPIRIVKSFAPVAVWRNTPTSSNRSVTYDFGQNMQGFVSLQISGAAGSAVSMRHAEVLFPPDRGGQQVHVNNIYYPGMEDSHASKTCSMQDWYANMWSECANQTDRYVLRGSAAADGAPASETYQPAMTYHGFRYVEVYCLPGDACPADFDAANSTMTLTAHQVRSDLPSVGAVALPNVRGTNASTPDILNALARITVASQDNNLWSIATDCPQREKRGWMGDAHMSSNELMLNHYALDFHSNFLRNIADDQAAGCQSIPVTSRHGACANPVALNGSVPDVTPYSTSPYGAFPGSLVWQSAYVVIARSLWRHYGELAVPTLTSLWPGLKSFVAYLDTMKDPKTGVVAPGGLGDWVPPGGNGAQTTPASSVSTFYWLMDLQAMSEMAVAVGDGAAAAQYAAELKAGKAAYHALYFNSSLGLYDWGGQTSQLLPLYLNIVPTPALRAQVAARVVAMIRNGTGGVPSLLPKSSHVLPPLGPNRLKVGIVGTTFVFDALRNIGADGLIVDVLVNDGYPSFGYWLTQGATTMWEAFEGTRYVQVSSRDHIMYGGGVGTYVYSGLAGLYTVSNATHSGWSVVEVAPSPAAVAALGHADASVDTRFGTAAVGWVHTSSPDGPGKLALNFTVPAGASAEVSVPALGGAAVLPPGLAIAETASGSVFWRDGAFVPGEARGVRAASAQKGCCGAVVMAQTGSGVYAWTVTGL